MNICWLGGFDVGLNKSKYCIMVKRKSQSDYDKMVRTIAETLTYDQYSDVKADIQGYDTPDKIIWESTGKGHVPDVTAEKGKEVIVEVETDDSINDQHTEDQWKLFSACSKKYDADFIVVVPEGSKTKAMVHMEELDITGEVIEVIL